MHGKEYCPVHMDSSRKALGAARRDADRRNAPWRRWYDTALWARLRAVFLHSDGGEHVVCEWRDPRTGERCRQPTTDVDHKVPHCGDWNLFTDMKNLQGLCRKHHSQKTAKEDGG